MNRSDEGLFPKPEHQPKSLVPVDGWPDYRDDAAGWLCTWERQQEERQQEQRPEGDQEWQRKKEPPHKVRRPKTPARIRKEVL